MICARRAAPIVQECSLTISRAGDIPVFTSREAAFLQFGRCVVHHGSEDRPADWVTGVVGVGTGAG